MSYDSDAFWAKARTKQEAEADKARRNNPYHPDNRCHDAYGRRLYVDPLVYFRATPDQKERLESVETYLQPIDDYVRPGKADLQWVIEDFLPAGHLAVLGGPSKEGKTALATALALAVATGQPFLGYATKRSPVIWLSLEENEAERALLLRKFQLPDPPPEAQNWGMVRPEDLENWNELRRESPNVPLWTQVPLFTIHERLLIDSPVDLEILRYNINRTGAKLLVVDPLYAANSAQSLTDGSAARRALSGLKSLCRKMNIAALVLHHFTKATGQGLTRERIADSNQIVATASMDLAMSSAPTEQGREIILIGKGRGAFANQSWLIESRDLLDYRLIAKGTTTKQNKISETNRVLAVLTKTPATISQITVASGVDESTVRGVLSKLARAKQVSKEKEPGKPVTYALKENVASIGT